MKGRKVGIKSGGVVSVHMPDATGNYATLCGLDGNDPSESVDQATVEIGNGAKIDCKDCLALWTVCGRYRSRDFVGSRPHA